MLDLSPFAGFAKHHSVPPKVTAKPSRLTERSGSGQHTAFQFGRIAEDRVGKSPAASESAKTSTIPLNLSAQTLLDHTLAHGGTPRISTLHPAELTMEAPNTLPRSDSELTMGGDSESSDHYIHLRKTAADRILQLFCMAPKTRISVRPLVAQSGFSRSSAPPPLIPGEAEAQTRHIAEFERARSTP